MTIHGSEKNISNKPTQYSKNNIDLICIIKQHAVIRSCSIGRRSFRVYVSIAPEKLIKAKKLREPRKKADE